MRHLKIFFSLLVLALMFGCQNETIEIPAQLDTQQQDDALLLNKMQSVTDILNTGGDVQQYLDALKNLKDYETDKSLVKMDDFVGPSLLQFYSDPEDFDCGDVLPVVNFDNARTITSGFNYYLDENSSNHVFQPGDILPGIAFESTSPQFDGTTAEYAFFISDWYNMTNALMSNYWQGGLIIHFSTEVTDVSFNLHTISGDDYMNIFVYDESYNYLGGQQVMVYQYSNTYWAVKSEVPIKKIVVNSNSIYGYEGVDNVAFGKCYNPDYDNDGFLNEDDNHPRSNLSETILIGFCNTDVTNLMVANGTMMADEVDDKIALIWDRIENTRSRWYRPQSDFYTEMYRLTGEWQYKKLITWKQRSTIMRCVYSSNLFTVRPAV